MKVASVCPGGGKIQGLDALEAAENVPDQRLFAMIVCILSEVRECRFFAFWAICLL